MTDVPAIRAAADERDVEHAADLITRSFDHLAANRYLVPDAATRLPVLQQYFHILTEHAAHGAGEVLLTDGAVLVTFDRTTDAGPPPDYDRRLADLAGSHLPRFLQIEQLLDKHHPDDPHWHLAFMAVEPDHRRRGLGNQLMAHALARVDALGVPAYLEATNPDNQRLYRRHGFTDMDTAPLKLDDGTPLFYRMWRTAQPH
jgi:ribosomal protein S18 acetylase RimI-like enzyme